jgi:16S rRNA (uracil1498-N3)-methyltransferase
VIRRLHTPTLFIGDVPLDPTQARHARDVLRLEDGTPVELFDDSGAIASGTLLIRGHKDVAVRVERITAPDSPTGPRLTIASAIPKGERADWMVEKLSELGVAKFIPLATERSVVKPEGKNKYERWARIATESAKQSRRAGVMRIEELRPVRNATADAPSAFYLSTAPGAVPLADVLAGPSQPDELTLLIGPEGGWTEDETEWFESAGIRGVKLTATTLRVETAAIAAAAITMSHASRRGTAEIATRMDANQRE